MKKNSVIRFWAPLLLLGGLFGTSLAPARGQANAGQGPQSEVQSQVANARALEQRNRRDLAVPVWKQVLESDPKNTEALAGLARAAAASGDSTLATMYLDRLRAINPKDPQIPAIEKMHPTAPAANGKLAWQGPAEDRAHRVLSPEEAAYQALNAKRIPEAESRFKAILAKQPRDASALAGMGYVRLQQGNYMGAVSYLEQAKLKRPNDQAVTEALEMARFRFIVSEGDKSLAAGDLVTAEKRYRSALELRRDNADALVGLGQTLLAHNDAPEAIPLFEQAIAAQPGMEAAWRGLVLAESHTGNPSAAVTTDQRMPESVHTALHSDTAYLQALASSQLLVGHTADAKASLDAASRLSSDDATRRAINTQLAGVLLATNQPQAAGELSKQVIAADPGNAVAWQELIQANHAMGQDDEALATLDRMPAAIREQAVRQPGFAVALAEVYRAEKRLDIAQDLLQKAATQPAGAADRSHTAIVLELASVDIEAGHPQLAYPLYQQVLREQPDRAEAWAGLLTTLHLTGHDREAIEQAALIPPGARAQLETNPAYLEAMSAAYAVTGRPDQATQLLGREERSYEAQATTAPPDVAVENAWLLYTSGNDTALYRELMALGGRTDLDEMQRKTVQTVWADWAIRQASHSVDSGGSAHALAILNAASEEFAANIDVQRALASGFLKAGDAQRATAIFKAQNMASASAGDYWTAISAAMAANDDHSTDAWLKAAIAKHPTDPQILLLKARSEQAHGDTKRAQQYYEQSLKAMQADAQPGQTALPAEGLPNISNGRRLAALLAPAGVETIPQPPIALTPPNSLQTMASAQPVPTPTTAAANAAGYASFQPYIAPPSPTQTPGITAATGKAEVQVQLGNSAAPPVQQPTEMTDVLPTARYVPNGSRPATLASDPNAAAAQAERVRRQRAEEASRRGQSHPPSEQSVTADALVPQPETPPASGNAVPDTGAQQYPQPRTPPPVRRSAPRSAPPPAVNTAPAISAPAAVAPVSQPTPAPQPPVFVAKPPTEPEVASNTVTSAPALLAAQAPIGTVTPRQQAQNALAAIEGSFSGFAGATGFGRFRNGTAGLDRLYDIEVPLEASAVFRRSVRVTAIANPVFLNSGLLAGNGLSPTTLPYLGTLPSGSTIVPAQQSSNGLGGELQLSTRMFGIAGGYTPYQFLVHNITGRVRLNPLGDHVVLYGERQPVKDTQLSYAGLRNPGVSATSGPIWGGVIATTGGVRVAGGNAGSTLFVDAEGGVLTGRHVQDNYVVRGSAEASFRVKSWANASSLSLGGLFNGMHYQRNEYGLSYGQGGYFSPAWYFAAGVPVTVRGGGDTSFHYDVQAGAGVRTFRQDAAAFFPLDSAYQNIFASCGASGLTYSCGYSPQTTTTGFDYAVHGEFSFRFAERWYGGGFVRSSNRNNYEDTAAGFFLRYTFRRQTTAEGRPTGLVVTDGIRPLQIP
ncbi:MAG TPA: cellulose synthase subunit BcsC-related outer membrane protein [Acidobacteriaceae bacterium]|jgi:tetratricopeptide (TPR) repeat protein|nr:cellulose synthase subunit BcsC-related outer membrane protein [Acidobacteriaceae bacterium]